MTVFREGNHEGLPLHNMMVRRGNPLWLPFNYIRKHNMTVRRGNPLWLPFNYIRKIYYGNYV